MERNPKETSNPNENERLADKGRENPNLLDDSEGENAYLPVLEENVVV